jgi:urocanate hydratase
MPSAELEFPEIADVYARFAALMAMSSDLGGWLLLYSGLDREGIAVAMASNVAGAASLGIEPDTARAKQALRLGVCDFLVNNLDEALRILKNEIRQKRGVSVVLTGAVDATVAEMVERGVQPEVLTFPVRELMGRGARMLPEKVEDGSIAMAWSVASGFPRWLPVLDGLAIASLQTAGPRVRWVEASPRYLGRVFASRFLRMRDAEADAFVTAVREAVNTGKIEATVSVIRGAETIVIAP